MGPVDTGRREPPSKRMLPKTPPATAVGHAMGAVGYGNGGGVRYGGGDGYGDRGDDRYGDRGGYGGY